LTFFFLSHKLESFFSPSLTAIIMAATKRSFDEVSNASPSNKRVRHDDALEEKKEAGVILPPNLVQEAGSLDVLKVYGLADMVDMAVCQGAWTIRTSRLLLYQSGCTLFAGVLLPERQAETRLELSAGRFATSADMVRFFDDILNCGMRGEWSSAVFDDVTFEDMSAYVANLEYIGMPHASSKFQARLSHLVSLATTVTQKEVVALRYPSESLIRSLATDYIWRPDIVADQAIPPELVAQVAPHLLNTARNLKGMTNDAEAKCKRVTKQLLEVKKLIAEFRESYIDDDEDGCDEDECVKSCAPGNRCDAHPAISGVSDEPSEYDMCPLSVVNAIAKVLGVKE
jgi:hypothetical protein